jgi:hypothetical protein
VDVLHLWQTTGQTYDQALPARQPCECKMRVALANVRPMRIELIERLEGDTAYSEFVEKCGHGDQHVEALIENANEASRRAWK